MKHIKLISHNEKETLDFGKTLASFLHKGDTVVLAGELN